MLGIVQIREFNTHAEISQSVDLPYFDSDTLYLNSLSDPSQNAIVVLGNLTLGDDELKSSQIRLNLKKSTSGEFEIIGKREARGRSTQKAQDLAEAINHELIIYGDEINFPYAFSIPKGKKWRAQDIEYTIKIPVGKTIQLDPKLARRVREADKNKDVENPWIHHGDKHFWTMEENGLVAKDYLKKHQDEREFGFIDYEDIQVEGMVKVNIKEGDYSIKINGKSQYTKKVDVAILGNLVSITTDMDYHTPRATVEITMPKLRSVDVEKTGEVNISGFAQSDMIIKSSSRYEVNALVNVDHMVVKQADRSILKIRGKGKTLKATVNDYGHLDTERFAVKTADVRLEHNGRANMAVSDTLRAYSNDHGHHHMRVDGNPVVLKDGEVIDLNEFVIDH